MTKRTKAKAKTPRHRPAALDTSTPPALYIADPSVGHCVIGDEYHPHDRDGVPIPVTASAGHLCTGHRVDLDTYAEEIKALWFDLAVMVEPSRSGERGGSHSKSPDAPAPIDLAVAALRDHRNSTARLASSDVPSVPGVIASWLLLVADEKPLMTFVRPHIGWRIYPDGNAEKIRGGRARGVLPSSVIAQLDLLKRNHGWMAEQEWIGHYWTQLRQVRNAMSEKVGLPSSVADRHAKALAQEIVDFAVGRR